MEGSRSSGKRQRTGHTAPPPSITYDESSSSLTKRDKVERALAAFRTLSSKLMLRYKAEVPRRRNAKSKALTRAASLMQRRHESENSWRRVGHVPGIEIGDMFQYRAELNVIGLHRQPWCGIDYLGKNKISLATSIVVTNRYANTIKSDGTLIYIGHGGNPAVRGSVPHEDQKMEYGNLALRNSMEARSPVRVIVMVYGKFDRRKEKSTTNFGFAYIYDGLYVIEKMVYERGSFGKLVYKFTMNRIPEQPSTCFALNNGGGRQFDMFASRKRRRSKGSVAPRDIVVVNDISKGKEKIPIRVVASTGDEETRPSPFDYITNVINAGSSKVKPVEFGCDCVDGCLDIEKCSCIVRNGGTMPYDCKGRLVPELESSLELQGNRVSAAIKYVFECGPSCKCPSSCANRVSQRGIQFQLEIFKTMFKGWGVRTRSFIPSGSFVCEYVGEVHEGRRAGPRNKLNDYAVNMGVGRGFRGFIDATEHGNVARFINHSCCPNLHVKEVMYDHNDMNLPHKMFFAVRDIPAGRELTFDYKTCKARIVGTDGNNCHCGAPICHGRIFI